MTTQTQTIAPSTFADGFTGPCGDCACEKWADCDYCGICNPEGPSDAYMREEMARADAEYRAQREQDEMSFGDWLASR